MVSSVRSPNRLLTSLSSADFELLVPRLKTIKLVRTTVLFEAGNPIKRVYFPHSGIISLVVGMNAYRCENAAGYHFPTIESKKLLIYSSFVTDASPNKNRALYSQMLCSYSRALILWTRRI